MPKYILDYIRLCRECSFDISTMGNMRSIVIPTLQREADAFRAAANSISPLFLIRQDLEQAANVLESAIRTGIRRCSPQPSQQELFAA